MIEETKTNEIDNQAKAKNPKILIAAVAAIILAVAVGSYNAPAKRLARQLDLGQKYLAELDYEQAVVAFNKVIEIDPKNVGAYLGLAEAYDGMGDLQKVSEVLEKGFELTRSDEIKGMLETYISEMRAAAAVNDIEAETFSGPVETENISTSVKEEVTTVEETVTTTEEEQPPVETTVVKEEEAPAEAEAEINWAKIYYDYLTQDTEGIGINEWYGGEHWTGVGYEWNLIYADNDMIPEIYMRGLIVAAGDVLLYISEGRVIKENFTMSGGGYIPYSGWLMNGGGRLPDVWSTLYSLENGVLREMGSYKGKEFVDSEGVLISDVVYRVGENEVSEEQYNEYIRNSTGGAEFEGCLGKNMPKSCLDFLRDVMQ